MDLLRRRHQLMWREEGIGYIKNGLVFWLDGLNKGGTANAWTDRINPDIIFTNASNAAKEIAKGWSFNGAGGLTNSTNSSYWRDDAKVNVPDCSTIEIVYNGHNNKSQILFITNLFTALSFGFYANGKSLLIGYDNQAYTLPVVNGNRIVSANKTLALDCGQRLVKKSDTYYETEAVSSIGYRTNNNYFTGEIYSIRMYNRQLTDDEMLNNQRIDNERYELGLTI